jgi:hypothetical protein
LNILFFTASVENRSKELIIEFLKDNNKQSEEEEEEYLCPAFQLPYGVGCYPKIVS